MAQGMMRWFARMCAPGAARDRVLIGGWVVLFVTGQMVLAIESRLLEGFSVIWLCAGIWWTRPTRALPLLLLTCPAVMCATGEGWSWFQPMLMGLLTVRIVREQPFSARQWAALVTVGAVVFVFSWPAEGPALLREAWSFPKRDLPAHFLFPKAVWAMFPFRQTVDRTLAALLIASLVARRRFFSTPRILNAVAGLGWLAVFSTYGTTLLPWQKMHAFLGTTNAGTVGSVFFNGNGVNVSYFTMFLALLLPWTLMPLRFTPRGIYRAALPLYGPVLTCTQRAFWLTVGALAATPWIARLFKPPRSGVRGRSRRDAAWVRRIGWINIVLAGGWYLHMGALDASSDMRVFVASYVERYMSGSVQPPENACSTPVAVKSSEAAMMTAPPPRDVFKRIEAFLLKIDSDQSRGRMWPLGLREVINRYTFRGAGAGTWARFHARHTEGQGGYFAHMHNTYFDTMFEYGWVPMGLVFLLCGWSFLRILSGRAPLNRLWIYFLVPMAGMAVGQHLLYSTTNLILLVPAFCVLTLGLRAQSYPTDSVVAPSESPIRRR